MKQRIALSTLVVDDYDKAITFFVDTLGFSLIEDTLIAPGHKRWVIVAPTGSQGSGLLLAQASTQTQQHAIGNQTGGRVAYFLYTDDFWRDFELYTARGVQFTSEPVKQSYGTVAVFEDISGNLWDLLQPSDASAT